MFRISGILGGGGGVPKNCFLVSVSGATFGGGGGGFRSHTTGVPPLKFF